MNTMFNPAPLTIGADIPGLLDIMITWHNDSESNDLNPGETQLTVSKTTSDVTFTINSKAPGTGKMYRMTKKVTINTKYPIQEYSDKDLYVLFDYNALSSQSTPINIEPYCVLFDDDSDAAELTDNFNFGDGFYMDRRGDGFEFNVVPPMLTVTQIVEQNGFRSINGIVPTNGNINIVGVGGVQIIASTNVG